MQPPALSVVRNVVARRFEIVANGAIALLQYAETGGRIQLIHTEVAPSLRGRGYATQLAYAALEYARDSKLRVVPTCPFVSRYLDRHPEYRDLIDPVPNGRTKPSTIAEAS